MNPQEIIQLRQELLEHPHDYRLQQALESYRDRVGYPIDNGLSPWRPAPLSELQHRMGPLDFLILGSVLSLGLTIGLGRWLTRRDRWAGRLAIVTGVGLVLLLIVFGIVVVQRMADRDVNYVVLLEDVVARTGNGAAFPPRFELPLPMGLEAVERARRGGWIQIQCADGTLAWVPETSVESFVATIRTKKWKTKK